jgi:hypothetical protein
MDSLEKIVAEKEEELKTLACELAEALKDRDNKLEFIKQAEKTRKARQRTYPIKNLEFIQRQARSQLTPYTSPLKSLIFLHKSSYKNLLNYIIPNLFMVKIRRIK